MIILFCYQFTLTKTRGEKEKKKNGVKNMEKRWQINMMTVKNKMCNPYTVKS